MSNLPIFLKITLQRALDLRGQLSRSCATVFIPLDEKEREAAGTLTGTLLNIIYLNGIQIDMLSCLSPFWNPNISENSIKIFCIEDFFFKSCYHWNIWYLFRSFHFTLLPHTVLEIFLQLVCTVPYFASPLLYCLMSSSSLTLSLSFCFKVLLSLSLSLSLSLTGPGALSEKEKDAARKEHITAFSSWLLEGSKTPPTPSEEIALRQVKQKI